LEHALVVIFEDLHWIDSETQALLDLLADSGAGVRLLLLVNYRPEYRHEWSGAHARISGDSPRITKTDGLDGGER
jgi:predicted ATPase